jgi:hypothetical protein
VPTLSRVDVAIAGGGDELLASPDDLLVPGDEGEVFGEYPLSTTNAEGDHVPVLTTNGDYKYIGRLVVGFNPAGKLVQVSSASGPVRVSGVAPDAVIPDPTVEQLVTEPVAEFLRTWPTTSSAPQRWIWTVNAPVFAPWEPIWATSWPTPWRRRHRTWQAASECRRRMSPCRTVVASGTTR